MFQSTFSLYMKEFVGVIIVWIAPWFGILIMDWFLRRYRYSASELQRTDRHGIYFGSAGGFQWNGIIAFAVGLVSSTIAFSKAPPPVNFPFHWMTPVSNHFGSFYCSGTTAANCGPQGWLGGADFSVPAGILMGALVYFILEKATGKVDKQVQQQKALEASH
jgi:purine-cytosine permease-like protein